LALNSESGGFVHRLGQWHQGEGPLYARLAKAVRAGIDHGTIPVGSRLPAERVLADALVVSRTTVTGAYKLLEEEGWLERRRGSGTRVKLRSDLRGAEAPTVSLSQGAAIESLLGELEGTVDLTVAGFGGVQALPADMLTISVEEAEGALRGHVGYLPSGLPELRERVAAWLTDRGLYTTSPQVLITSGAQQAVGLVAALVLQPGDVVVLENPTYFGAIDVFRSRGARLVPVPLDRDGVDVEALRGAAATSAPSLIYVTPTCNNPTGSVLSPERRRSLARVLGDFGGYVIEDQTLAPLLYEDETPPSIASLTDSGNVVVVGSMSKLFWGGLRVGWVRGPETLITRLARLKVMADLGSSLPSQLIASRLLPRGAEVQARRREQLRERWRILTDLAAELLPSWELWPPSGGPFAWAKLPEGDANRLAQIANRHGVRIMPGSVLSVDGSHADHVRLSLTPDVETLAVGVRRLAEAWKAYDTPIARRSTEPPVIV
jgi:DNA-binding transcriptional MocR family regulator